MIKEPENELKVQYDHKASIYYRERRIQSKKLSMKIKHILVRKFSFVIDKNTLQRPDFFS